MSSMTTWDPLGSNYVQGGLRDGEYANAQTLLIAAGPPHLADISGGVGALANKEVVYPIGLVTNFGVASNRAFYRIFEIGSDRSYFISGRTISQLTLGRVYYNGPSLLRVLYAYYGDKESLSGKIEPLFKAAGIDAKKALLHRVQVPPGFDNLWLNLASDLFTQPIGLLLVLKDTNYANPTDAQKHIIGLAYMEQVYVPTHNWASDAQGVIIQEQVALQFERIVPIKVAGKPLLTGLFETVSESLVGGVAAAFAGI